MLCGPLVAGVSCGSVEALREKTGTMVAGLPKVSVPKFSVPKWSLPEVALPSLFPDRVKVVKARPEDMKELPLGHEKLVAYQKQKRFAFWPLGPDVPFVQPDLPEAGEELDGTLLPPKLP